MKKQIALILVFLCMSMTGVNAQVNLTEEGITPASAGLFIKNIKKEVSNITTNPKLRSILEFPVLFLGAKPSNTPAFYNFMNYADFGLGT